MLIYIIAHTHTHTHFWHYTQDCWGIKSALKCFKTIWQSSGFSLKTVKTYPLLPSLLFPLNWYFLSSLPPKRKAYAFSTAQFETKLQNSPLTHMSYLTWDLPISSPSWAKTPPTCGVTERMSSETQRWLILSGEEGTSCSVTITFKFIRKLAHGKRHFLIFLGLTTAYALLPSIQLHGWIIRSLTVKNPQLTLQPPKPDQAPV